MPTDAALHQVSLLVSASVSVSVPQSRLESVSFVLIYVADVLWKGDLFSMVNSYFDSCTISCRACGWI